MKRKLAIGLALLVGMVILVVAGIAIWGTTTRNARLAEVFPVEDHSVPVPTPLTPAEIEELRANELAKLEEAPESQGSEEGEEVDVLAGLDLDAIAKERAIERGQHLVNSRYFCVECHGTDFSGGVMIDAPPMGTWMGPNLTSGKGNVVADYTTEDWERIVRHGVRKDGTAAVMPSDDFAGMSDQELSDIIAYIQSIPPVDRDIPVRSFGPVSTMLIATGALPLPATKYASRTDHPATPPKSEVSESFGAHLAQTCTGCHRQELNGGPILGGDPAWPNARNLTQGEGGLGPDYTFEDFDKVMREGVNPEGAPVATPMDMLPPYTSKMTPVEMKALWKYIQSIPPQATGS